MASQPELPRSAIGGDSTAAPSDGARTVISLLLFVHLFALAVTFFGNYEGSDLVSAQARGSALVPRLQSVIRPYTYPLWLDWPLQNHLTYGAAFDFDHYIEVAITPKDGTTEPEVLRLPEQSAGPGLRANRLRRLAWYVARLAADRERSEVLPLAIGGGILKQHDATKAQVRSFRTQPLILGETGGIDESVRATADERIYAADVFFLPGLDRPQLNKVGEARDVAPVTGPSGSGSPASRPSDDRQGASQGSSTPGIRPRSSLLPAGNPLTPPALPPALPPSKE
jgi:hypothetical protein